MAYAILGFHVFLAGAIGLLVIFFRSLVSYMFWIFLLALIGIGFSAYRFYRKARKDNHAWKTLLDDPVFANRSVEISLLGGFASIKLGKTDTEPAALPSTAQSVKRLEDSKTIHMREIEDLARMLEAKIITADEFEKAKQRILRLD